MIRCESSWKKEYYILIATCVEYIYTCIDAVVALKAESNFPEPLVNISA